jgi:hypothetical protein
LVQLREDPALSAVFAAADELVTEFKSRRRMRPGSLSPGRSTWIASHRGSPEANRSSGNPSGRVDPRSSVNRPSGFTETICVSCQSGTPPVSSP